MALVAASWADAPVGQRAMFRFAGQRRFHERVLLWPIAGGRWVILTPDGDIYDEDAGGDDVAEAVRLPAGDGRPDGVAGRPYKFKQPLPDAALCHNVAEARAYAAEIASAEDLVLPTPVAAVNWEGDPVDLPTLLRKLRRSRGYRLPSPRPQAAPLPPAASMPTVAQPEASAATGAETGGSPAGGPGPGVW